MNAFKLTSVLISISLFCISNMYSLTINFRCIKNCIPLSNPSNNLHLEAKINFIGLKFEWYYQFNDINVKQVDDIALTDVPAHMLVVKRNKLEYGTIYNFIVKCEL